MYDIKKRKVDGYVYQGFEANGFFLHRSPDGTWMLRKIGLLGDSTVKGSGFSWKKAREAFQQATGECIDVEW